MRPILRDIRAVAGVTGVAVLVKQDGHVEQLFPAAFTERHTEELLKLVTAAYQRLRGFTRLSLRFERVVVHLFNQAEYLLFATVLPDIDESLFETVVKSKSPAIARSLLRRRAVEKDSPTARSSGESAVFSSQAVEVLIDAFNGVTRAVGRSCGWARVAACWRQARDTAAVANDALTAVEVDAGGHLAVRKGRVIAPSAANMESLAKMVQQFLYALGTDAPEAAEALYALTEPHRALLERHGFYHFLGAAFGGAARRKSRQATSTR